MADHPTCTWTGASGTGYTYWIYPRHPDISGIGNYIYALLNDQNQWVPVYIGQGDLSVRLTKNHHQIECINSKRATHVHARCHKVENEATRLAEERDLLGNYGQAYAPTGCNQREGG
jgi:hypothetical protein